MEIGEKVDSNYHPLIIWLIGNGNDDRKKEGRERRRTMRREEIWDKKGRKNSERK